MSNMSEQILVGQFEGDGYWKDIVGDSKKYRVSKLAFEHANGAVTMEFEHDLYEENDEVVARFVFDFEDESRFNVLTSDQADGVKLGTGHLFDMYCQYLIVIGDQLVENRLVFSNGGLRIFGSSSRNKKGRFIWWEESLRKTS